VLSAVLSLFFLAAVAYPLCRRGGRWTAALLAVGPAACTAWLGSRVPAVAAGERIVSGGSWAPGLGVGGSFALDGLSLLFALLVCGIGTLVVIYTAGYFDAPRDRGRFLAYLLAFMASMLGLVLADNLILLFVFWELTTVTSYLLIGFKHGGEGARKAALQSLLVTAGGGLALLAGILILAAMAGSFELSEVVAAGDLREHPLYPAALLLLGLGALTKSAQFPFHFWLPNAMAAPTPASAFLHSSTMVKAGVYLLARLSPALGGTPLWTGLFLGAGAATMILGSWLALRQTDLKRLLAFSTVTILGTLVALLGLGTPAAAKAAAVLIVAHALYKGALFLIVGAVDLSAGSRDLLRLGGLARSLPVLAGAALLAGLSMAGIPPLFGFIGKEVVVEAAYKTPGWGLPLALGVVVTGMLTATAGLLAGLRPFFGRPPAEPPASPVRPASPWLWLGPAVLAAVGFLLGPFPVAAGRALVAPAAAAIAGEPVAVKLALWHGVNPVLGFGVLKIAGGLGLLALWPRVRRFGGAVADAVEHGPERLYQRSLAGLFALARGVDRLLQEQPLSRHLRVVVAFTAALVGGTVVARFGWPGVSFAGVRPLEVGLAAVILVAAAAAVLTHARLAAIAALGVVGFAVSLVFLSYGAPDLAMTQLVIETLTVVMVAFALYHLPAYRPITPRRTRRADALLALVAGGVMSALVLAALRVQLAERVSDTLAEWSVPLGHGRNVVNVILVDFRALDTLGEIAVLAVAGVGAVALLELRVRRKAGRRAGR